MIKIKGLTVFGASSAVRVEGAKMNIEDIEVYKCDVGIDARNSSDVTAENYSFEETTVAIDQDSTSNVTLVEGNENVVNGHPKSVSKKYFAGFRFPDKKDSNNDFF
jgi:hypothetical protein